jgi:soluble lytic murein transglycosylase-like protein
MKIWSAHASRLMRCLVVLPVALIPLPSLSIDFKIDVPNLGNEVLTEGLVVRSERAVGMGIESESDELPTPSTIPGLPAVADIPLPPLPGGGDGEVSPFDVDSSQGRADGVRSGSESVLESVMTVAQRDPFEASLGIYETTAFPVPACLVPNVAFWKKIYRDVKTDEALIHDRENLGRIFGKLRLPTAKAPRARALKLAREHFSQRLQSLAGKVAAGARLSVSERELLSVFEPEKRDAREILDAASRLRIQSGLQERFSGGVRRSLGYLPTITPILKQYGVPKDIVHLPHVESSYVRTARSKVGAVGLWQIMPETMRRLMGSSAVRKRTHLTVSTQAAAKLLRQNYRMLKSWPLALTAYNHGAAGVNRGVRQTGSRDICVLISQYNSRSFKFASSNFYAQFLAARHVALDEYQSLSRTAAHRRVLQPLLAHASREKL